MTTEKKLTKNNKIHKTGFDQGMKEGYRRALKHCAEMSDCEECRKTLKMLTNQNGKENN